MAVGAKAHIGMQESILQSLPRDAATTRLDFKWMGAAVKGGFHLGSMYLVSRIGVEAKENKDILDAAAARLKLLVGPWAIGCDGNCTPEQLAKTGWLKLVGPQSSDLDNRRANWAKGERSISLWCHLGWSRS